MLKQKRRQSLSKIVDELIHMEKADCAIRMLEPREFVVPDTISSKTLEDMDRAISNFKMGSVSPAIDLSDF